MQKPPTPGLSRSQRFQKFVFDAAGKATDSAAEILTRASEHAQAIDKKHGVTEKVAAAGKRVGGVMEQVDARYDVTGTASKVYEAMAEVVEDATTTLTQKAKAHGVTQVVTEGIFRPVSRFSDAIASNETVHEVCKASEVAYGNSRRFVKDAITPDLPTYDCDELLLATRRELNYIAACILQISPDESSRVGRQFGRAVTAKISGITTTTALLGIVATFGHAGTGAAISGLSGAAATSATMAWVGSLVGGGVAAGAALTGGLAFVVGLGAYKALASDRRDFESLSALEQRLVQSCWMLAAVAQAYRERPHEFTAEAATEFLNNALIPLHADIDANLETVCAPLDGKHAIAMRQHALTDFNSAVIKRFGTYLQWAYSEQGRAWNAELAVAAASAPDNGFATMESDEHLKRVLRAGNAEAAIGGVFAELLRGSPLDDTDESRLVLAALRRSSSHLRGASERDLGEYLRSLSSEGLKGEASNVKGIYHELYYVDRYNATHHDGTAARLHEPTNFPGSDVQIYDLKTGEVHQELQLKAVATTEPIHTHMDRYPHTPVAATDEVAGKFDGHPGQVSHSGFSNDQLNRDTHESIDDLRGDTSMMHVKDTAEMALGIVSTVELVQMLRGEREFPVAIANIATKVAVSAGATAVTAFLFS